MYRDYVNAFEDTSHFYYAEAQKLARGLLQQADEGYLAYVDKAGVLRWKANDTVTPRDVVDFAIFLNRKVDIEACDAVRHMTTQAPIEAAMNVARSMRDHLVVVT